jgi:hypothetical protein
VFAKAVRRGPSAATAERSEEQDTHKEQAAQARGREGRAGALPLRQIRSQRRSGRGCERGCTTCRRAPQGNPLDFPENYLVTG